MPRTRKLDPHVGTPSGTSPLHPAAPVDIDRHLAGAIYPATRDDLVDRAKQNNAPEAVIVALDHLPREWYSGLDDVADAWPETPEI